MGLLLKLQLIVLICCLVPFNQAKINLLEHLHRHSFHTVRNAGPRYLSFMSGEVIMIKKEYPTALSQLHHVYKALEEQCEKNKNNRILKPILFPKELNRVEAIREDLCYYTDYYDYIEEPFNDTREYIEQINHIGETQPALLIGHHYTRYLAGLYNSKKLKEKVREAYHLEEEGERNGLAIFEYPNIKDVKEFKRTYRNAVESVSVTEDQLEGILHEATTAFQFTQDFIKKWPWIP